MLFRSRADSGRPSASTLGPAGRDRSADGTATQDQTGEREAAGALTSCPLSACLQTISRHLDISLSELINRQPHPARRTDGNAGVRRHFASLESLVQIDGDSARLLPVSARARPLFGKDGGKAPQVQKNAAHRWSYSKRTRMTLTRIPVPKSPRSNTSAPRPSTASTKPCFSLPAAAAKRSAGLHPLPSDGRGPG